MAAILGMNAKLYFQVGGQAHATNTWTELTNVSDVTLNLEASEADVTTRGNNGWRAQVAALRDGSLEFEMVWDTADAGFTAIKDAFLGNLIIGLGAFDSASGQGLQGDFMITNFTRTEPLEEAMKVSVTAKLTFSANPPTWETSGPVEVV